MTERWVRREEAIWRGTARHLVVLPPGSDRMVVCEGSTLAVWEALLLPRSLAELVANQPDTTVRATVGTRYVTAETLLHLESLQAVTRTQ